MKKLQNPRIVYLIAALLATVFLVWFASQYLPIADDYCYASDAKQGIWMALRNRYLFAGGNLFETLVVLLQVGVPLVVVPLHIASSFSWLVTLGVVAWAFREALAHSRNSIRCESGLSLA